VFARDYKCACSKLSCIHQQLSHEPPSHFFGAVLFMAASELGPHPTVLMPTSVHISLHDFTLQQQKRPHNTDDRLLICMWDLQPAVAAV
jgi:hypothetical protein